MENKATIQDFIRHRRSVFPSSYTDERVSDSIVEEMIESAQWAPTHKLTEPWRFTVFSDEGLKSLATFQSETYKKVKGDEYDPVKFDKLKNKPLKCSHIIAVGMKRDPQERIPEIEEVCAVACAVQNMLLTASSHGIGAYWSTGGITFWPEGSDLFDGQDTVKLLGFIFIGTVREGFWPEGKRTGMEDKVHWVSK